MANHEIVPASAFTKGTADRRKSATSFSFPGLACSGTYSANFVITFSFAAHQGEDLQHPLNRRSLGGVHAEMRALACICGIDPLTAKFRYDGGVRNVKIANVAKIVPNGRRAERADTDRRSGWPQTNSIM